MMLSDYVSSFVVPKPAAPPTHRASSAAHQSLGFRKTHQHMKTFNLASIMTEGQKYYFKQIRFLSRSVTALLASTYLASLPCHAMLLFFSPCLPASRRRPSSASLRSIRRMLTTRLTHEVYLRCTLSIRALLLFHISHARKSSPATSRACL